MRYHGGPISKCLCKEESVLHFVTFSGMDDPDESNGSTVTCDTCFIEQDIDRLLWPQVRSYALILIMFWFVIYSLF